MSYFRLSLLGSFQAQLDGRLLSAFQSNKVRALLSYLAVEAPQPQQRVFLAGLLWSDWPEPTARTYLRQGVANLRQILGDRDSDSPFLITTRQWLQLRSDSETQLDVRELRTAAKLITDVAPEQADSELIDRLVHAANLYRGDFMEGFFLDDCSAYEEWQLLMRERLRRDGLEVLDFLTRRYESHGDLARAQGFAWRRTELAPFMDRPRQQLIRLLALTGEYNVALLEYERYAQLLKDELGAEPSQQTQELYAQIRKAKASAGSDRIVIRPDETPLTIVDFGPSLPPFLSLPSQNIRSGAPFVGRGRELEWLENRLDRAVRGDGHLILVSGSAGQGKTMLLREFSRRAMASHEKLIAVSGRCSSYEGSGDSLLPFQEIFAQLTGDFEADWAAGILTREHAGRLWLFFPSVLSTILLHGQELVGTLLPGAALAARVATIPRSASWLTQLTEIIERSNRQPRNVHLQPQSLLAPFTKVLQTVSDHHPLLLWLDDLHLADLGSLALLFHLSERLAGYPVLIIGTYRTEDVLLLENDEQHPLQGLIQKLKSSDGSSVIDLNEADDQKFVDAYLELEPHRLSKEFRAALIKIGGGHPLFTVELVRNMRDRGELVRDENGYWVEGETLDWQTIPTRVEAIIEQRMNHLSTRAYRILTIAAVQGEQFLANVVATVLEIDVASVEQCLIQELEQRHQLVRAQGIRRVNKQRLSIFRFRHILFQQYLLERLNPVERVELHEAVAAALVSCYGDLADLEPGIAANLGWHYSQALLPLKAAGYHYQAGLRALRLSIYEDAGIHLERGLALLDALPQSVNGDEVERDLLLGLISVKSMLHGNASPIIEGTLNRAVALCRNLGDPRELFHVLWHLWQFHFQRGDHVAAQQIGRECVEVAGRTEEPAFMIEARCALGPTLYRIGHLEEAHTLFSEAKAIHDMEKEGQYAHLFGFHPAINYLSNDALVLWYLGYPTQARDSCAQALLNAQEIEHPSSTAYAYLFATALYQRSNHVVETESYARETIRLSEEQGFSLLAGAGTLYLGWAQVRQGDVAAIPRLSQGIDRVRATGMNHVRYAALLADAYTITGRYEEGLALVYDLLTEVAASGEREWEAELHRLHGDLLLLKDPGQWPAAEECFHLAIQMAREQKARSLELRAAVSLARSLLLQGDADLAREHLRGIFDWFTEGFDTPDLIMARQLLATIDDALT